MQVSNERGNFFNVCKSAEYRDRFESKAAPFA